MDTLGRVGFTWFRGSVGRLQVDTHKPIERDAVTLHSPRIHAPKFSEHFGPN